MLNTKVNGLMVVRVPEDSVQPVAGGGKSGRAPAVGQVLYRGVDRLAWWDVGNRYYESSPSPEWLRKGYERVTDPVPGSLCLGVCTDLSLAQRLLEVSNASGHRNELIAVGSEVLEDLLGGAAVKGARVQWRGFDPYVVGEFSLLRAGLFTAPGVFEEWESAINEYGLFESTERAEAYAGAYIERAGKGPIEPLAEDPNIDIVRVGTLM